jgi:hypothetical protein
MKLKPFCEKSIYWVLNYRDAPRKQMHKLYRYGFVDDHSNESWKWTLTQSRIIQQVGLQYWLCHTEGPYGFQHWQDKYKTK